MKFNFDMTLQLILNTMSTLRSTPVPPRSRLQEEADLLQKREISFHIYARFRSPFNNPSTSGVYRFVFAINKSFTT
ncbi:MAG: hypothetical protein BWX92_03630 [Deltaproteobacteria bacterium ADurb.Bin135]|nr:MAG: hypothetical protein BWX92_03630 [Deltaproteobacteria bacterium ADurb.Bin135]